MSDFEETDLVYGTVDVFGGDLVFIPRKRAEYLAALQEAKDSATTWGELRERIPAEEFDKLALSELHADADVFDELDPAVQQEFLAQPFDAGEVGLIADGDWPAWTQQEMMEWMPDEVQEKFGKWSRSMVSGECLQIDARKVKAVVAALQAHGYRCEEDEDLVRRASGF